MIGRPGCRWRRSTARSALAAVAVVWVCDAGHTDESFYEASLPEFGDRLEGVLVVQADNRDIQGSKEYIGIGWNSHVCARLGCVHVVYNTTQCKSSATGQYKSTCGPGLMFTPHWLKLHAMLDAVRAWPDSKMLVFLDSDAMLSLGSRVWRKRERLANGWHPDNRTVTLVHETWGYWIGMCKGLEYAVCVNSGVIIIQTTPSALHFLRTWWSLRDNQKPTPWENWKRSKQQPRHVPHNTSFDWPYEQDRISQLLNKSPMLRHRVHLAVDSGMYGERLEHTPITKIFHPHRIKLQESYTGPLQVLGHEAENFTWADLTTPLLVLPLDLHALKKRH